MRILLVRHGETEWNRTGRFQGRSDIPLNPAGISQAQALAGAIKDEPLSAIYTSPLRRAVETARQVKVYHPNVPILEEPDLMEMDLGDFEGMDARQWAAEFPDFREMWRQTPSMVRMPGGECLMDVQNRAVSTLERVMERHGEDQALLICSHNFVILSLLCHASGIPLDRFRELEHAPAAVSILKKRHHLLVVDKINERSHLDADHTTRHSQS